MLNFEQNYCLKVSKLYSSLDNPEISELLGDYYASVPINRDVLFKGLNPAVAGRSFKADLKNPVITALSPQAGSLVDTSFANHPFPNRQASLFVTLPSSTKAFPWVCGDRFNIRAAIKADFSAMFGN